MPQPGDPMPLSFKLFNSNGGLFVRATVANNLGVPIAGSPFALVYQGLGTYGYSGLTFPSGVDYVTAVYEAFNDSGFTQISQVYTDGVDVFTLTLPATEIITLLEEIQTLIEGLSGAGGNGQRIVGILKTIQIIKGKLGGADGTLVSECADEDGFQDVSDSECTDIFEDNQDE